MGSTTRINLLNIECISNATIHHEESNIKSTPISKKEQPTSNASTRVESEGGTTYRNKCLIIAKSHSQLKSMTKNHSKSIQAKEVLWLFTY